MTNFAAIRNASLKLSFPNKKTAAHALLVAAILLMGISHIAFLPPFEGFDEIGHYSYIREMASTSRFPLQGESFLAKEIMDYRNQAPIHYIVDKNFYKDKSLNYAEFFASRALQEKYKTEYRERKNRPAYQPSSYGNWTTLHPPLYYLLLAPLMKATDSLSFVAQLFVLRVFSFLLAVAGLVIGWRGTWRTARPLLRKNVNASFLLYPFIAPMFFSEFGRIGNDSLTLFIMSIVWSLLLTYPAKANSSRFSLALGLALALGLLTKGFFIVITASIFLYLLFIMFRDRQDKSLIKSRLDQMLVIFAPVLFALIWYLCKLKMTGSLIGYAPLIKLGKMEGFFQILLDGILERTLFSHLHSFLLTWLNVYTQSLAFASPAYTIPLLLLSAWLIVSYFQQIKKYPFISSAWLPVWLIIPLLGGLIFDLILNLGLHNPGSTPGWYLHILMSAFGAAFAYSLHYCGKNRYELSFVFILIAINSLLNLVNVWFRLTLYVGCSIENKNRYFVFPGGNYCLDQLSSVYDRLALLAFPAFGTAFLAFGFACLIAGLCLLFSILQEKSAFHARPG